jgi:hypothetical protein
MLFPKLLLCFSLDGFAYSAKIMVCYSPLSEVAATNAVELENFGRVENVAEVTQTTGGDEVPAAFRDEGSVSSVDRSDDSMDGGASNNKNLQTYNIGASTITLSRIKEMVEIGYFVDGEARAPEAKAVPKLDDDEAVMYEGFFVAGLCMPPHPALADILLQFQAQLHQLLPNAIAQLSNYF